VSGEKPVRRKRRKHRWVYLLILGVVVVVGVICLFRWRLKRQLRRRIDAIREAGYPVTCAELDEWYSIPEDAENAAEVILQAVWHFRKPQRPEDIPVVGSAEMPGRTESLSDETSKLVEEYLAENKQALAIVTEAVGIEHSRYPISLNEGLYSLMPYLSDVRDMAKLLKLAAVSHAENKQAGRAVASVESIFAVAHSLSEEPVIISQLVLVVCEAIGVSAIERTLNRVELSDEQLAELSRVIAEAGEGSGFSKAMAGERCGVLEVFREPDKLDPRLFGGGRLRGVILTAYKTAGLTTRGAIVYLDFVDEFAKANQVAEHKRIEAAKAIEARLDENSAVHMIVRMLMPTYSHIVKTDLGVKATLRAARVGLAIERYRLGVGKVPDTLAELVPAYLDAVPMDPFDGEEIRYRRLEEGYVAYSVGEDLSDDGGRERPASKKERENWDVTFIVER